MRFGPVSFTPDVAAATRSAGSHSQLPTYEDATDVERFRRCRCRRRCPAPASGPCANRHIQLIAIGGTIGTGLFMGSGRTFSLAGPAVLVVYGIIGFFLFFVLRAMGELLLSNLNYKSFVDFASDLLGPVAGFFIGWSYWFAWIVTGIAEIVAITGYSKFWWPDLPTWLPTLVTVGLILMLNLFSVRNFGEMEFRFALIKIAAIVCLIVVGAILVANHFVSPHGARATIENLWNDGGFFATGFMGVVSGFQIAFFAFVGVELVGAAAAETTNPSRTLPRAINAVPVRVAIFYPETSAPVSPA